MAAKSTLSFLFLQQVKLIWLPNNKKVLITSTCKHSSEHF
ncbi:hypothetical protein PMAG_a2187 [Pseudoalteromonas mariniglutinosa NCIMB 1770]|nr:hypothetical protein [Pseudoalteromonas mariniglutinosa NCIMB 1770]